MERQSTTKLRIGAWCVNPASGEISRNGETARVEVRTMRLLLRLAEHSGEVVSIDDLLNHVWSDVTVAPDSVYQAVASLRRLLGDDPSNRVHRDGAAAWVSDGCDGHSLGGSAGHSCGQTGKRKYEQAAQRTCSVSARFGERTSRGSPHQRSQREE